MARLKVNEAVFDKKSQLKRLNDCGYPGKTYDQAAITKWAWTKGFAIYIGCYRTRYFGQIGKLDDHKEWISSGLVYGQYYRQYFQTEEDAFADAIEHALTHPLITNNGKEPNRAAFRPKSK